MIIAYEEFVIKRHIIEIIPIINPIEPTDKTPIRIDLFLFFRIK